MGGAVGGGATHSAMTRVVAPICTFLLIGCATHRLPAELRGYAIVVEERDPQSVELARALRERGVKVRARVRGGSGRTAALFYFTYSDPGPGQPTWFHVRLADTRSGAIVSAATVQLDSTTSTQRARAVAAVRALAP